MIHGTHTPNLSTTGPPKGPQTTQTRTLVSGKLWKRHRNFTKLTKGRQARSHEVRRMISTQESHLQSAESRNPTKPPLMASQAWNQEEGRRKSLTKITLSRNEAFATFPNDFPWKMGKITLGFAPPRLGKSGKQSPKVGIKNCPGDRFIGQSYR